MKKHVVFFDTEISVQEQKILDIGAVSSEKGILHTSSTSEFYIFAYNAEYLCGHNVVHHDMKYLAPLFPKTLCIGWAIYIAIGISIQGKKALKSSGRPPLKQ